MSGERIDAPVSAWERDYFPSWGPALRRLRHPLVVLGTAAFASLLAGVGIAPQGFVACGALLTIMVVGVVWPWIALRGTTATLRFLKCRSREGEGVVAELVVRNRWPFPLWGVALERGLRSSAVDSTAESSDVALGLARIAPWSRETYRWTFVPAGRGEYPTCTPCLTTSFPFGVSRASIAVEATNSLLVWPSWTELATTNGGRRPAFATGETEERTAGDEGETSGAREYRRGDGLRHVHWRQSARHGRLIVRERQRCVSSSLRIVVDARSEHHATLQGEHSLDWAVRIAASLAHWAARRGESVELSTGAELHRAPRGSSGLPPLLDALARCAPAAATRSSRGASSRSPALADEWRITTSRGWRERSELGAPRDVRWIILELDEHEPHNAPPLDGADVLYVPRATRGVLEQFRRAWSGGRNERRIVA